MIKKFYYKTVPEYYIYYTVLSDHVTYQYPYIEQDTFGAIFLRDEIVTLSPPMRRLVFNSAPTILGIIGPGYDSGSSTDSLTSITIPASITEIIAHSLFGCNRLVTITYESTMDDWNNITKGSDWNYGVPATAVHCTDGDVSLLP